MNILARKLLQISVLLAVGLLGCEEHSVNQQQLPVQQSIPPEAIESLEVSDTCYNSITLQWKSTYDKLKNAGYRYVIYYSSLSLNQDSLGSVALVKIYEDPLPSGSTESVTIRDLYSSTLYYLAVRMECGDDFSDLSNIVSTKTGSLGGDLYPPGRVTDLTATRESHHSIRLNWTSPGDDSSSGTVFEYDIRIFNSPITERNWDGAYLTFKPEPQAAGTPDSVTIALLPSKETYYFAMRSRDESPNQWSRLSNCDSATTSLEAGHYLFDPTEPLWINSSFSSSITLPADLDNDGDMDVIAFHGRENLLSVLENDGLGHLTHVRDAVAPEKPRHVELGHFNEDGYVDIAAVARSTSSTEISILMNDGNGGFLPSRILQLPDFVRMFCVSNFVGDSLSDIAVQADDILILFHCLGDGDFEPGFTQDPDAVLWLQGDFDGDGDSDLAFWSGTYQMQLFIAFNNGDGTFGEPQYIADLTSGDESPAAADFDGNGSLDLVFLQNEYHGLTIYSNSGSGVITFTDSLIVPERFNLYAPIVSEINGDEYADILCCFRGPSPYLHPPNYDYDTFGFLVFVNNGDGTFLEPDFYPVGGCCSAAADFDGDGLIDVLSYGALYLNVGSE
ncbi:MAG: VCBS repeat-containing protein [candidate division Zixibacteria bacterium]|nr:VCBS repeat-containing protein [candidate division Zixibacteria bacterium]